MTDDDTTVWDTGTSSDVYHTDWECGQLQQAPDEKIRPRDPETVNVWRDPCQYCTGDAPRTAAWVNAE